MIEFIKSNPELTALLIGLIADKIVQVLPFTKGDLFVSLSKACLAFLTELITAIHKNVQQPRKEKDNGDNS